MARLDPKRRSDPKVLAWARKQGRTVADGKVIPDAVRECDAQQAKAAKNWFPDLKTVYHDYGEGVLLHSAATSAARLSASAPSPNGKAPHPHKPS